MQTQYTMSDILIHCLIGGPFTCFLLLLHTQVYITLRTELFISNTTQGFHKKYLKNLFMIAGSNFVT